MDDSYSNLKFLRSWIHAHDRAMEHHKRYILGPTLRNLILHTYALIGNRPCVSREAEVELSVITRLLDINLNDGRYEQAIIGKNYSLTNLKAAFHLTPNGKTSKYDLIAINLELGPLAQRVQDGEMLTWMLADLRGCAQSKQLECDWEAVAAILITEASMLWPEKDLKRLPEQVLTQAAINTILSDASQKVANDDKGYQLFSACIDHIIPYASFSRFFFTENAGIEDWYGKDKRGIWHRRLDDLSNIIVSTINLQRSESIGNTDLSSLPFTKDFVRMILETEIISIIGPLAMYPPFVHMNRRVADITDDGRLWGDSDIRFRENISPEGASANTEARMAYIMPSIFAVSVTEYLVELVYSMIQNDLIEACNKDLIDSYEFYKAQNADRLQSPGYPNDSELILEFSGWHHATWRNAQPIKSLTTAISHIMSEKVASNITDDSRKSMWRSFVIKIDQAFRKDFSSQIISNFNRIPWNNMDLQMFNDVLILAEQELFPDISDWDITFGIENLDCESEIFETNGCIFYDPNVWHFNESLNHFITPQQQKNVSHVHLVIPARTHYQAAYSARNKVITALDLLSSPDASDRFAVVAPSLMQQYLAIRMSDRSGVAYGEISPSAKPGVLKYHEHDLGKRAIFFGGYFARVNSANQNELQAGLIRIDHWYRIARFQQSEVEQFLYLWIALEHLTSDESHIDAPRIFRMISALRMTWIEQFGIRILPIQEAMKDIVDFLEANIDIRQQLESDHGFSDWRSNRILLTHSFLCKLKDIVSDENADKAIVTLIDEVSDPRKARQITNTLEKQQEESWFTLSLLNRRRNQIVHNALTNEVDLRIYRETLEDIVRWVAARVHNALMSTPPTTSIEEVINLYQEPFLSWSSIHHKLIGNGRN